jgi:hypothetical protein
MTEIQRLGDVLLQALAEEQNNPALITGAYHISAATLYHLGDFQAARGYAMRGVQIWRSGAAASPVEDVENRASKVIHRTPPGLGIAI